MEGKNVLLHVFMYNVMSDFTGVRQASEQRVNVSLHHFWRDSQLADTIEC